MSLQLRAIRRLWRLGAPALLSVALAASCATRGKSRGGLMLEITTDGSAIDRVDIEIGVSSKKLLDNNYSVPSEAELPTTVAIVSNGDAETVVQIAVIGWQGEIPVDRRDAIVTQIPTDRVAAMRVVLSARCSRHVSLQQGKVVSNCTEGTTCDPLSSDAGCTDATVVASTLDDYVAGGENTDPGSQQGTAGTSGTSSAAGTSGTSGTGGTSGTSGTAGVPGASGTAGADAVDESAGAGGAGGSGPQCGTGPGCPPASVCGDSVLTGYEQCDDGNAAPGDGCSASCRLEPGFKCAPSGTKSVCSKTVCGDGRTEGFETCDDSNSAPFDGCSPSCQLEPKCSAGACSAVCGDGLKTSDEACDDGNTLPGDGCSASCKLESGFACTTTYSLPALLEVPVVYRDLLYADNSSPLGPGHPDFQAFVGNGPNLGLVKPVLDKSGKPAFAATNGSTGVALTTALNFCWWFHDANCDQTPGPNLYAKLINRDAQGAPTTLTFAPAAAGVYQYNDQDFFPVDSLGWNAATLGNPQLTACGGPANHNFAFTTEAHYAFTFQGGEKVSFVGDDDFWLFVNGKLAVDVGGVHLASPGEAELGPGLVVGNSYDLAMFQAERHTCLSTFNLSLTGFARASSSCVPM